MIKERSSVNDPVIQKLLADGEIERAAAIALFTLRLKLSVQVIFFAIYFSHFYR